MNYEKCCIYCPESRHLDKKHLALFGYLIGWKYFHKYKDIIVNDFRFSLTIRKETSKFLSNVRASNPNATMIGVHVRRGDFITLAHIGYTVATEDYIVRATRYYQDKFNCMFVIGTNDKTWTESVFSGLANTAYVFTGVTSPYTDISIISSCDHVITTTGTFSWWIGYLSKGTVLYYKDFPREGSWLKTT